MPTCKVFTKFAQVLTQVWWNVKFWILACAISAVFGKYKNNWKKFYGQAKSSYVQKHTFLCLKQSSLSFLSFPKLPNSNWTCQTCTELARLTQAKIAKLKVMRISNFAQITILAFA